MLTTHNHPNPIPRLKPGLTRLETPAIRSQALHSVVFNEFINAAGETLWIDSCANASTHRIHQASSSYTSLAGLQIARAFTAYQHYSLIKHAVRHATHATDLIVLPCITALYRDTDLPEYRRTQFLTSACTLLHELATTLDIPIIITDPGPPDQFHHLISDFITHKITCIKTDLGFRFETPEFDTTVYWTDGFWQTTIPYWVKLVGAITQYEHHTRTIEDLNQYLTA